MHRCSPREKENRIFRMALYDPILPLDTLPTECLLSLRPTVVRAFASFSTCFAPDRRDFQEQIRRPSAPGVLLPPLLSDV